MPKSPALIYIVEDSVPSARLYQSYLETLGYRVKVYHTGLDAVQALDEQVPDILVQDVQLPDISGLDILKEVTKAELPTKTIIITSETELDYAVEATRHGAFDFIEKPFNKDRLLVTVANALRQSELLNKVEAFSKASNVEGFADFIGSSIPMQLVYKIIENVAPSNASVFITGESGTGKELCASAIHQVSKRSNKPFIAINCAAIPKDLFESEIFGHVKGSFSGATTDRQGAAELADGGTLFLDELCEMDLNLQAKFLRLIQSGTFQKVGSSTQQSVDVRFVCATNRNPQVEVNEGRFREDLFYRLNVVPIELPALRDRDRDVLKIATKLLTIFNTEQEKSFDGLSHEVSEIFLEYDWPGNVRELQNVIENTVIMNSGHEITKVMLPESFIKSLSTTSDRSAGRDAWISEASTVQNATPQTKANTSTPVQTDIKNNVTSTTTQMTVDDIQPLWITEKQAIEAAIRLCHDNIPVAASHLGVSPSTLYRKIKSWERS